jgi:RNA polymerase sigma-70 factor, ECF subfamily
MDPANPDPEDEFIRRSQQRDAEAITALYRLYAGRIYRYCLLRLGDEATAEDLTEEVFLNMIEALPRYVNNGTPFAAWLYRIAHDRVTDYYRRQARHPSAPLSDSVRDTTPEPEAQAIHRISMQRLWQAAAQLSDDYQMVLQLRFVEGLGLDETARLMRRSLGATKVLQHRALRRLAQLLRK